MKRRALQIAVLLAMAPAPAATVGQQDDGPKLIVTLLDDTSRRGRHPVGGETIVFSEDFERAARLRDQLREL